MTQAPATPSLVERLRSYYPPICQEAADALEAQQARIAELAGERDDFQRMYRHWSMIADQRLGASNRQLKRARDLQALADRYEKALREIQDLPFSATPGRFSSDIARQALSSQGRHEGVTSGSIPELPGVNAVETRPIPGYPKYYARSDGLVERDGVVLRPIIQYPMVRLRSNDRRVAVPLHTLVALAFHGERPPGAEIDHLDDDPMNSRPHNLAYKTRAENQSRRRHASHNTQKTHCPRGHAYDADNTYLSSDNRRICRACKRKATLPASPDGPSQIDRVWAAINVLGAPDTACTTDEDRAYCRAIGDALSEIEKLGGRPQ